MNTGHSKRGFTGLDDNAPLRLLAQIIHRDRALGRFRKLRNSLSVASSQRDVLPKDAAKKRIGQRGGGGKSKKKRGKDTRGCSPTKAERRLPFVEIFRILLAPSEVAGRVFSITLYANETYALAEPRNKLHVYR